MSWLQQLIFAFRAKRINRQLDALQHRSSRPYAPSGHMVGHMPTRPTAQDKPTARSPWLIVLAILTGFGAGCVLAGQQVPAPQTCACAPRYDITTCVYLPAQQDAAPTLSCSE